MGANHHRRRRAAVIVPAAAALVGGLWALAAISEETKPRAQAPPEAVPVSPLPEDPATRGRDFTVPAESEPRDGVPCPLGWRPFENPVMHYSVCTPPGWGFSDLESAERLREIPAVQMENLHLLSPEAFPWERGARLFDVLLERDSIGIELNLLQPGARASSECEPRTSGPDGAAEMRWCVQSYDRLGVARSEGPLRALKIVAPLKRAPAAPYPGVSLEGSRLLIVFRGPAARIEREVSLAWRLARTLRTY